VFNLAAVCGLSGADFVAFLAERLLARFRDERQEV
jgi:hypothetical protein